MAKRDPGDAGRHKANVARVEDDILPIDGRLNFAKYESMQPVYSEYSIGHHRRSLSLSNKIGQSKVGTEMKVGVFDRCLVKGGGSHKAHAGRRLRSGGGRYV
jgi:hypothetical protein